MAEPRSPRTRGDLARAQLGRRGYLYFGDVEEEVRVRLERLTGEARKAFALTCAERAMAWHVGLPAEEQRPFTLGWQSVLESIRAGILGSAGADRRVSDALEAFHASPYDHAEGQDGPGDADEDAAAAAIFAAECFVRPTTEQAEGAASRLVELAFSRADKELRLDPNDFAWDVAADPPSPLAQENMHAAVQSELRRQLADLEGLANTDVPGFLASRAL